MIHIWVGPKPPPLKWMNTWKDKHPDWNYFIFTDEMLKARSWENQELINEYYRRGKFNGVADLIRYELLWEMGGFLPPADSECLHPIDELLDQPEHFCYSVYENEQYRKGFISPIMAASPGNRFVRTLIDTLHLLEPRQLRDQVWMSTGNEWLSRMIAQHNPQDIKIWPSYTLIPTHYDKRIKPYDGPERVYARQFWGSTGGGKSYKDGV